MLYLSLNKQNLRLNYLKAILDLLSIKFVIKAYLPR